MKFSFFILLVMVASVLSSCVPKSSIMIHGHRGARGLYPENTIAGFIAAVDYGVDVLELDVVISADSQVVVSHEPWMSAEICRLPGGEDIGKDEELTYNLYTMSYDSIATFDCGLKPHSRFTEQKKGPAIKPKLESVFNTVEAYLTAKELDSVYYNIEIKSRPEGDGLYHPEPETFSDLVYGVLESSGINKERFIIQSFDFRVLKYWYEKYPEVKLSALIEGKGNPALDPDYLISELGFTPAYVSPDYHLLDKQIVEAFDMKAIGVVPWTVNDPDDMEDLIDMGVFGLITDYPDRAAKVLE